MASKIIFIHRQLFIKLTRKALHKLILKSKLKQSEEAVQGVKNRHNKRYERMACKYPQGLFKGSSEI
ncbi:MAG: hypothetical protein U5N85_00705 [Arcicella sp.]|nr:hypothetical protein [Arcicella sp.]